MYVYYAQHDKIYLILSFFLFVNTMKATIYRFFTIIALKILCFNSMLYVFEFLFDFYDDFV